MARRTTVGKAGQGGVALLALLIVVAAMGAALAATGTFWRDARQRANERELLFVGMQYRRAIQAYYNNSPGLQRKFPPTLEALLRDERVPSVKRYLRRPYRDPMTDSNQWGIVPAPTGGIMGVYSLAKGQTFKRAGFPAELGWQEDKTTYAEWKFVFLPPPGG